MGDGHTAFSCALAAERVDDRDLRRAANATAVTATSVGAGFPSFRFRYISFRFCANDFWWCVFFAARGVSSSAAAGASTGYASAGAAAGAGASAAPPLGAPSAAAAAAFSRRFLDERLFSFAANAIAVSATSV